MSTMSSSYVTPITDISESNNFIDGNNNSNDNNHDEKKIDIKNNNTNAFNEVKEYIEKLNADNKILAKEVFSPLIATLNAMFLGMNYFGGDKHVNNNIDTEGDNNNERQKKKMKPPAGPAITSSKYFGFHLFMLFNTVLIMVPVFYIFGINLYLSVVLGFMANGGIILTTPWPEMRIFESKFLALRLQNKNDKVVKDIKKNVGVNDLVWLVFMTASAIVICALPGFLIIIPYARASNELYLEYIVYLAFFLYFLQSTLGMGMGKWQSLVVVHQKSILKGIKYSIKAIEAVIYEEDANIGNAKDAQEKLTYITKQLMQPIQHELKHVWGAETFWILVGGTPSVLTGLVLLFPNVIYPTTSRTIPNVSDDTITILRVVIALFAMLTFPFLCFFV